MEFLKEKREDLLQDLQQKEQGDSTDLQREEQGDSTAESAANLEDVRIQEWVSNSSEVMVA